MAVTLVENRGGPGLVPTGDADARLVGVGDLDVEAERVGQQLAPLRATGAAAAQPGRPGERELGWQAGCGVPRERANFRCPATPCLLGRNRGTRRITATWPDDERMRGTVPSVSEPAQPHPQPEENSRHGRLTVRPYQPVSISSRTGLLPLDGPAGELLALAYVPAPADGRPYRLVLLLHGAGGSPRQGLDLLLSVADEHRLLLVAPKSMSSTWDLIVDGFGPDVRRIDRVLEEILDSHPVERVMVGGFSDGASYALSIGLANGDLFDAVLAFSPGFAAPLVVHGQPRVFVSHGIGDRVLPIDVCSRRLVPRLEALDYRVIYEEFDGGHEVPEQVVIRGLSWLLSESDRAASM